MRSTPATDPSMVLMFTKTNMKLAKVSMRKLMRVSWNVKTSSLHQNYGIPSMTPRRFVLHLNIPWSNCNWTISTCTLFTGQWVMKSQLNFSPKMKPASRCTQASIFWTHGAQWRSSLMPVLQRASAFQTSTSNKWTTSTTMLALNPLQIKLNAIHICWTKNCANTAKAKTSLLLLTRHWDHQVIITIYRS